MLCVQWEDLPSLLLKSWCMEMEGGMEHSFLAFSVWDFNMMKLTNQCKSNRKGTESEMPLLSAALLNTFWSKSDHGKIKQICTAMNDETPHSFPGIDYLGETGVIMQTKCACSELNATQLSPVVITAFLCILAFISITPAFRALGRYWQKLEYIAPLLPNYSGDSRRQRICMRSELGVKT